MSSLTDAVQGKQCTKCKEFQPFENYAFSGKNKDGLQGHCRKCQAIISRKWFEDNYERQMWNHARNRAKKKGIKFTITVKDIVIPALCPVLGIPLEMGNNGTRGGTPNSPSLDRIDNSRGYEPGNVIVISWRANKLKGDGTWEELATIAEWLRVQKPTITTTEDMLTC